MVACQAEQKQYELLTLLRAMMKGVFRIFSNPMDSTVWGSRPCMRSTTRMAMSHSPDPRERRLVKDSCPAQHTAHHLSH